jgi:hypothetical protein
MNAQSVSRVFYGPTDAINGPFVAVALVDFKGPTQHVGSMIGGCQTLERSRQAADDLAASYGCIATEAVVRC